MIKVAIRHFIYEKCISVLFNAIKRNFSKTNTVQGFIIGKTYKHVIIQVTMPMHYYNFRIEDIKYTSIWHRPSKKTWICDYSCNDQSGCEISGSDLPVSFINIAEA